MADTIKLLATLRDARLAGYKRRQALLDLARDGLERPEILDALIDLIKDKDDTLRRDIVQHLCGLTGEQVQDALIECLQDRNDMIRRDVVEALSGFKTMRAESWVRAMLDDDSVLVVSAAEAGVARFERRPPPAQEIAAPPPLPTPEEQAAQEAQLVAAAATEPESATEPATEPEPEPEPATEPEPEPEPATELVLDEVEPFVVTIVDDAPKPEVVTIVDDRKTPSTDRIPKSSPTPPPDFKKPMMIACGCLCGCLVVAIVVILLLFTSLVSRTTDVPQMHNPPGHVEVEIADREPIIRDLPAPEIPVTVPAPLSKADDPQWIARDDVPATRIRIVHDAGKARWLEEAVAAFDQTHAGQRIEIDLVDVGLSSNAFATGIPDVWMPSSSLTDQWHRDITASGHRFSTITIYGEVCRSPMVFVFWQQRYQAFIKYRKQVSFAALAEMMPANTGWPSLGVEPRWGQFRFGHTNPEYEGGVAALAMMAYEYSGVHGGLSVEHIGDEGFAKWLTAFESRVVGRGSTVSGMMRDMLAKGPSAYDAVCTFENIAIETLNAKRAHWGDLQVVYPAHSVMCNHPYVVIHWRRQSDAQRQSANVFHQFLLSEPVQRRAVAHGLRPVHPGVDIDSADSPFQIHADKGIQIDVHACEAPSPVVVEALKAL